MWTYQAPLSRYSAGKLSMPATVDMTASNAWADFAETSSGITRLSIDLLARPCPRHADHSIGETDHGAGFILALQVGLIAEQCVLHAVAQVVAHRQETTMPRSSETIRKSRALAKGAG
jgi:hypothetical protein